MTTFYTYPEATPPTVTGFDRFGTSVAIDGSNVLIGAFGDNTKGESVGQAHLFDATTGTLLQTFDDPTVTTVDQFGLSVALDGSIVLIGAHRDDQAHLFDATTGALLQTLNDPTVTGSDIFGGSVAIDGGNVLVGAWGDSTNGLGVGQAYLFRPVPIPATILLFASALTGLVAVDWRKRFYASHTSKAP